MSVLHPNGQALMRLFRHPKFGLNSRMTIPHSLLCALPTLLGTSMPSQKPLCAANTSRNCLSSTQLIVKRLFSGSHRTQLRLHRHQSGESSLQAGQLYPSGYQRAFEQSCRKFEVGEMKSLMHCFSDMKFEMRLRVRFCNISVKSQLECVPGIAVD